MPLWRLLHKFDISALQLNMFFESLFSIYPIRMVLELPLDCSVAWHRMELFYWDLTFIFIFCQMFAKACFQGLGSILVLGNFNICWHWIWK